MNVLTSNPIFVNKKRIEPRDMYLSIEGASDVPTIKAFQYFVNYNNPSAKLSITGVWDSATSKQKAIWGAKFDSMLAKYPTSVNEINKRISGAPVSKGGQSLELMMNPDTASTIQPSPSQIEEKKKQGFNWDKASGTWTKVKDSGLIDSLFGLFGKKQETYPTGDSSGYYPNVQNEKLQKEGMSKGAKIAIVVGVAAAVGLVIYMVARKKK